MQLLQKVASFSSNKEDFLQIYKLFVRPILEQSCHVWSSNLTRESSEALERVKKAALKVILGMNYKTYEKAQEILQTTNLNQRRNKLGLNFPKKIV